MSSGIRPIGGAAIAELGEAAEDMMAEVRAEMAAEAAAAAGAAAATTVPVH